ncbi:MAG TPA: hypothetical protein VKZ48_07250 [Burkholderiales bacterium]|nr:hypothetical protein [Burkholderiales bacterium]
MSKPNQTPPDAGITDDEPKFPPQTTDPESEFSVDESLKQSFAEERDKAHHQSASANSKQKQQGGSSSSESEFSVSQRRQESQGDRRD